METMAVFKLPASPNIVRAGCREPQIPLLFPDYKLLPREWPPIDMYNYLSNYFWHFNISLFNFFPNIFFDIRYGYVLFRDHTDALNAPDHNELTYNTDELKMNIAGTTYTSSWGATYTFHCQTKDGDLLKETPNDQRSSWNEAWAAMEAITPVVNTNRSIIYVLFGWQYNINLEWAVGKSRGYVSFDTSSLSGKTIISATLKLDCGAESSDYNIITDGTLNIYQKAWDTLDTADWNGGNFAGSLPLTSVNYNDWSEIDIDTTLINKTGETQFEIIYKVDADGDVPTDPYPSHTTYGGGWLTFHSADGGESESPKLVVRAV